MNKPEAIDQARAIVGTGEPNDFVLEPTIQAARLRKQAPQLARLLEGAAVSTAARQYEEYDEQAVQGQQAFRRTGQLANLMVAVTTILGGSVMAVALIGESAQRLQVTVGLAGVATGSVAAFLLFQVKRRGLLRRWMSARALAETYRHRYFELITSKVPEEKSRGVPLRLLAFEYFRRYELEVQVAYYRVRRHEHQRSADRGTIAEGAAVILAAIATGGAGAGTWAGTSEWAGLGVLGVAAAAVAGYGATQEAITQDGRNAERYGRTYDALSELSARLDEVRTAVAGGNVGALTEFVAALHEQLSVEHREWLEAGESTRAGVARLNEALAMPAVSSE